MITDFMYNSVPREAGVVDNNVYLPTPELRCLLHQLVDMFRIQHIPRHGNGAATRLFDFLDDALGFRYAA